MIVSMETSALLDQDILQVFLENKSLDARHCKVTGVEDQRTAVDGETLTIDICCCGINFLHHHDVPEKKKAMFVILHVKLANNIYFQLEHTVF